MLFNITVLIWELFWVQVFYIFLIDEGVRWLLAHNRKDEAVRVLNKVAKINKITLSSKAKDMLTKISEDKVKAEEVTIIFIMYFTQLCIYGFSKTRKF